MPLSVGSSYLSSQRRSVSQSISLRSHTMQARLAPNGSPSPPSDLLNLLASFSLNPLSYHKGFKAVILTSAGIGKQYTENKHKRNKNKYQGDKTDETYRLPNGAKSALPIYYRNKIYTEEERQKLWLNKLDKQERYINGTKISVKNKHIVTGKQIGRAHV